VLGDVEAPSREAAEAEAVRTFNLDPGAAYPARRIGARLEPPCVAMPVPPPVLEPARAPSRQQDDAEPGKNYDGDAWQCEIFEPHSINPPSDNRGEKSHVGSPPTMNSRPGT